MSAPTAVTIRDCAPRDGLQGEQPLSPEQRAEVVLALDDAGVPEIEVASFVSPRAVPAMDGAAEVVARTSGCSADRWVLVPNRRGAELAVDAGASLLTVTVSASPVYSEKNVGMTVDQSIEQVASVCALDGVDRVDAVLSCAFGSPFGDSLTPEGIAELGARLDDLGVARLTLADTTGTASPRRIERVLERTGVVSSTGEGLGLHLHDTRGTALLNALTAWGMGVARFDTSLGGLGGSPFAPGAGGNLASEDLVLVLEDMGVVTGIDLSRLLSASGSIAGLIGREVPSRVAAAGPLPPF